MTAPAAKPHTDAVVSLLTAATVAVGRGKPPSTGGWQGPPGASNFVPYAVIYPFTGRDEATSLARTHDSLDFTFQLTCVGAVQDQVETLMDKVRAALIGITPSVASRTAFAIYQVPIDRPVTRDDAVAPPVHYGITQFHFRSDPT
ncbi:hypothetical protein ACIBEJ_35070 [Nonomuraea sp. NPDC050790]|uniref:hypothetical protein n=1 Tax=Nonomuraea sp. NPDC050790 TaxID=3364371 RepID=UPI003791E02E